MRAIERVLLVQTLDAIARLSLRQLTPLDLAALLQAVAQTLRTQDSDFHQEVATAARHLTEIVGSGQKTAEIYAQAVTATEALRLRIAAATR